MYVHAELNHHDKLVVIEVRRKRKEKIEITALLIKKRECFGYEMLFK